jgi:hypothetical protein
MRPLRVEHLPLADARLVLDVPPEGRRIEGLPPGVVLEPPG